MGSRDDSWNEWAKYVLEELKSLRSDLKEIQTRNWEVQLKVNELKTKSIVVWALVMAVSAMVGSTVGYKILALVTR